AVVVRRGIFNGQIHKPRLFVDSDLRPYARVAVDGPRVVLPRIVAELARARDGIPHPQELARPHVEGAHEALRVVVRHDRHAFLHRGADDHDILDDGRRRVDPDFAGYQIDGLTISVDHAVFQVEDAVLAERSDGLAGMRVQLDESIARRHKDDAVV